MALLKKLKSLFGLDDGSQPESSRDVGVTVEKERRAGATAGSATEGDDGGSTTEHTTDETETTDETAEAADQTAEAADQTAETTDQTAETTDQTAEAADETAETTDQTAEAADETAEAADEEESEPVQEVKGIGPAYADRLGTVGIETIADLAEADPEAVAAETDISETRVTEWVKRAKARS